MLRDKSGEYLPCTYLIDYDDTEGIDMDQAVADVAIFPIMHNCILLEVGALVTEVCAGSVSTPIVAFDRRVLAGSDVGRVDAAGGNLVLSTTAAGKVMYDLAGANLALNAGDELVVELATRASGTGTGHIRPYARVLVAPEVRENMSDMVETA